METTDKLKTIYVLLFRKQNNFYNVVVTTDIWSKVSKRQYILKVSKFNNDLHKTRLINSYITISVRHCALVAPLCPIIHMAKP